MTFYFRAVKIHFPAPELPADQSESEQNADQFEVQVRFETEKEPFFSKKFHQNNFYSNYHDKFISLPIKSVIILTLLSNSPSIQDSSKRNRTSTKRISVEDIISLIKKDKNNEPKQQKIQFEEFQIEVQYKYDRFRVLCGSSIVPQLQKLQIIPIKHYPFEHQGDTTKEDHFYNNPKINIIEPKQEKIEKYIQQLRKEDVQTNLMIAQHQQSTNSKRFDANSNQNVIFYKGPCKQVNTFSCLDHQFEKEDFKILEHPYENN